MVAPPIELAVCCVPNFINIRAFLIKGFVGPFVTIVRLGTLAVRIIDSRFAMGSNAAAKPIKVFSRHFEYSLLLERSDAASDLPCGRCYICHSRRNSLCRPTLAYYRQGHCLCHYYGHGVTDNQEITMP